jgi:hypothetical protein
MSILKGWFGEKVVALSLWLFLDRRIYRRFHDVIIPSFNGTTQIDHLLISPFGLFVIETKNYQGWIFGSEDQASWTQSIFGKKQSFQNPLRQNFRHTQCLARHLDLDPSILHSIIFFVGDCTLKTPMPPNVRSTGLRSYIHSFKEMMLSEAEIYRITAAIQRLKDDPSLTRQTHLDSLQDRHNSTSTCPKCSSPLVQRTSGKGPNSGSSFLGCSTFPRCRYIKPA